MREHGRRRLDRYETPAHYTAALTKRIGAPKGVVYEPCVGAGHLLNRLDLSRATKVITNDLDRHVVADHHWDVRRAKRWGTLGIDWCITNPPFSAEQRILEFALQFCKNVAMLARLSFLEPTISREPFWLRHQSRVEIIALPRYSFRNNDQGKKATDNQTCVWLVFREKHHVRQFTISDLREKVARS